MPKLSFVIPCYGSEQTIISVIREIDSVVSLRENYDYEIIAVNDCSPDKVYEVMKTEAQTNKRLKVINFTKNMGKHSAVMAGFSYVTGDYAVSIDDDGQCPLDGLWKLMDALTDDYDIAMAEYPVKKQSKFKNFGSSVNSLMSRILLKKPKEIHFSNFIILKRYIVDEILRYKNPYPYLEGLILRTTTSIASVEMEERDRFAGTGNFTLGKSLSLWINGFTAFSVKPLRIATILGFITAAIGFIYAIVIIILKLVSDGRQIGYSSMMSALLFIGGMLMLMLGLIGEYIGRIYICINNSPQYVIRNTINVDNDDKLNSRKEA